MKSALIHSATDVVVKGGRPLFALDTVTGGIEDVKEMMASLKRQSLAMSIPILGGNTLFDEEAEPRCSLTVVGRLVLDEPIRDSGARKGDQLILLGEPIWGSQEERIKKAQILFKTWYALLDQKIMINAGKDVTKGGLVSAVYEVAEKSGRTYTIKDEQPYSVTRNLDNFLITVPEKSIRKIEETCTKTGCSFEPVGKIL
jgi:selenophosphate synthetase-related protein